MTEQDYYENAALWDRGRYETDAERTRFTACSEMIPPSAASVLDVGAGNGAFLRHLEETGRFPTLAGVERAGAAIDSAVCRTPIVPGSIERLPYEDRSFDAVSTLEVIEHLPFGVYEAGLRELERVAGRYILVSVPYREHRVFTRCPYCGCRFNASFHMRRFDDEAMRGLFAAFRPVRMERIRSRDDYVLGPWIRWAIRSTSPVERVYPSRAVCPQCSYTRRGGSTVAASPSAAPSSGGSLRERVGRALPRRSRARWIAVLYERDAGA